ncbi:hypothetical protein GQ42DRAFT_87797 [Ramicandelaber brevisporus]|nr:hypothetical protein GQ42DRAFT_87797 [Ramicandelaber brevisporus]
MSQQQEQQQQQSAVDESLSPVAATATPAAPETTTTTTTAAVPLSNDAIAVSSEPASQRSFLDTTAHVPREFYLKRVSIRGQRTANVKSLYIVTQDMNGPCPLVSLVNTLLLRDELELDPSTFVNIQHDAYQQLQLQDEQQSTLGISADELLRLLGERLIVLSHGENGEERFDLSNALMLLSNLLQPVSINPRFDSPVSFEASESKEMEVFRMFGVRACHGWIVPPPENGINLEELDEHELAIARKAGGYDELTTIIVRAEEFSDSQRQPSDNTSDEQIAQALDDAAAANRFLMKTATQLTRDGIAALLSYREASAEETELFAGDACVSVMFRNCHFNTVCRREGGGGLYALVADSGYRDVEDVVWEHIVDPHGGFTELLDGDFEPSVERRRRRQQEAADRHLAEQLAHQMQQQEQQQRQQRQQQPVAQRPQYQSQQSQQSPRYSAQQRFASPRNQSIAVTPKTQTEMDLALALELQNEENRQNIRYRTSVNLPRQSTAAGTATLHSAQPLHQLRPHSSHPHQRPQQSQQQQQQSQQHSQQKQHAEADSTRRGSKSGCLLM